MFDAGGKRTLCERYGPSTFFRSGIELVARGDAYSRPGAALD
jgi:hypothetical protein